VTPEVIAAYKRAKTAQMVGYTSLTDLPGPLFDLGSGESLWWYSGDPRSGVRLYPASGSDPTTGERLKAVTPNVVEAIRVAAAQNARKEHIVSGARADAEAEQAARATEAAWRGRRIDEARFRRVTNDGAVLVAVKSKDGKLAGLSSGIESRLRAAGAAADSTALIVSGFNDSEFEALAAGNQSLIDRLGLQRSAKAIIVGQSALTSQGSGAFEGMVKTEGRFEVTVVPIRSGAPTHVVLRAIGTGFTEQAALGMTEQRLLDAFFSDPISATVVGQ
jgi:hypothetical protein